MDPDLISALQWLADELHYDVREDDTMILLVAGQRRYPLMEDMAMPIWVAHNDLKLTPASAKEWDRDDVDYRASPSGTPSEWAVVGRELWLHPPPDATALDNSPTLSLRWIAYPTKVPQGGPRGLPELDQRLAAYQAALFWLWSHPSEENQARADNYTGIVERLLGSANRRHAFPIEEHEPSFAPDIYRQGAAR